MTKACQVTVDVHVFITLTLCSCPNIHIYIFLHKLEFCQYLHMQASISRIALRDNEMLLTI